MELEDGAKETGIMPSTEGVDHANDGGVDSLRAADRSRSENGTPRRSLRISFRRRSARGVARRWGRSSSVGVRGHAPRSFTGLRGALPGDQERDDDNAHERVEER